MNKMSYGIIFMDCSMPIMNGFECTDKIRSYLEEVCIQEEQPRIIAITGHTEKEYIQQAWNYKMDELVPKPAKFEVIREILEESFELQLQL